MNWITAAILTAGALGIAGIAAAASPKRDDRFFEMRTYIANPGKMSALHARFRDHTCKLFEKHGMTNIGYWIPTDGPASKNTLVYILAFPSREAAKKAWDDFRTDPDWIKVRDASEANGKIVEKVDSVFMEPTDFSKLK